MPTHHVDLFTEVQQNILHTVSLLMEEENIKYWSEYLLCDYKTITDYQEFYLKNFDQFFMSYQPPAGGAKLLKFGGGSAVCQLISAAPKCKEIVYSEFIEGNCEVVNLHPACSMHLQHQACSRHLQHQACSRHLQQAPTAKSMLQTSTAPGMLQAPAAPNMLQTPTAPGMLQASAAPGMLQAPTAHTHI